MILQKWHERLEERTDATENPNKPWAPEEINGEIQPASEFGHYTRKLGNSLILEIKINQSCGSRTWSGKPNPDWEKIDPPWNATRIAAEGGKEDQPKQVSSKRIKTDKPAEDGKRWGKFHIIAHGEWKTSNTTCYGSHLKSAKILTKVQR